MLHDPIAIHHASAGALAYSTEAGYYIVGGIPIFPMPVSFDTTHRPLRNFSNLLGKIPRMPEITFITGSGVALAAFLAFGTLLFFVIGSLGSSPKVRKIELDAAPKKPVVLTVRISGISDSFLEIELRSILESLDDKGSNSESKRIISRLSLTPSVSGSTGKTATVSYRDLPEVLRPCMKPPFSLDPLTPNGHGESMVVDTHFRGLTSLYTPETPSVE